MGEYRVHIAFVEIQNFRKLKACRVEIAHADTFDNDRSRAGIRADYMLANPPLRKRRPGAAMQLTLTPHHAKYFAHDLTRRAASGMDRLSMALFDAAVDLNPHQIEAALFALQSPLSKGVILADEVGLGKTIEAGIVLCQFWAERKRRPAGDLPGFHPQAVGTGVGGEVQSARAGARREGLPPSQAKRPNTAWRKYGRRHVAPLCEPPA